MKRMAFILRTLLDAQCARIVILRIDFSSPSQAVLLGITARMVPLVTCMLMLIPTCQESEVCKLFLCACVRVTILQAWLHPCISKTAAQSALTICCAMLLRCIIALRVQLFDLFVLLEYFVMSLIRVRSASQNEM